MKLADSVFELYKNVSCSLPDDVVEGLRKAENKEKGLAKNIINGILANIQLAKESSLPICQDTGVPVFYVNYNGSQKEIKEAIISATRKATEKNFLRPNAVDPITGENTGNNIGENFPVVYFHHWDNDFLRIELMLKGGGSENIGMLYSLPDSNLNAGRDVNGIKKCVIDAMFKAQGKGCSPNIVGVGIGGSKTAAMALAKRQLLRKVDDVNDDKDLAGIEEELFEKLNKLGIGPMGLGGGATVLGVKAAKQHRHPASFFVAVSFMCWACRRGSLIVKGNKIKIE